MSCGNPRHADCTECSGEVVVGQYADITMPRLDADGFPQMSADGRVLTIALPLPVHVVQLPCTRFDPTSLVGSQCDHGLPEHPDPALSAWAKARGARTFVRSKYVLDAGVKGVVCVLDVDPAMERPADLTVARA